MAISNSKKATYLYWIISIVGLFVFFAYVHPLMIYDGDDWAHIAWMRRPIPDWHLWNATKVLPETAFPLVGYISAFIVNPFLNDYILAVTYTSALFFAVLSSIFFYMIGKYANSILDLGESRACMISVFALLLSFIVFKEAGNDNGYLLYSFNLTCYFHYVLPALVNGITVLILMCLKNGGEILYKELSAWKSGSIVLLIYLSLFSNIFHSVILSVFLFYGILSNVFNSKDKGIREKLYASLKECKANYVVIGIWLVSLLIEANGGRARYIGKKVPILDLPFNDVIQNLLNSIKSYGKEFVLFCLLLAILYSVLCYRNIKLKQDIFAKITREIIQNTFCFFAILVYLIPVCAKAAPWYIMTTHVQISFLIFGLFNICLVFGYLLKQFKCIQIVYPTCLFILFFLASNNGKHFKESNISNINPMVCKIVDEDIINQIQSADRQGVSSMVLTVPKGDDIDNWPHPNYMGGNLARTLYTHGLITKELRIKIKPDPNMIERLKREKLHRERGEFK